jgi:hypothetical protein
METHLKDNKFYVPKIEEFRVGFEFEYQDIEYAKWVKSVYKIGWRENESPMEDYLEWGNIRVKLLDREDIDEVGFTHIGASWFENKELDCRIRKWKDLELDIYKNWSTNDGNISDMCKVFAGKIKNKSELQQILKMVL